MKNKSELLNELATALAKAQGEMKAPVKDKTAKVKTSKGYDYSYSYSDLATVVETNKATLAKHGLSVTQPLMQDELGFYLETLLMHSSGQWISSRHPLPASVPPQELGSALTYARRYSLSAILGIAADTDDDAAAAQDGHKAASSVVIPGTKAGPAQSESKPVPPTPISKAPICCGKMMMESKFIDQKLGHKPWYCTSCKNTIAKDGVA